MGNIEYRQASAEDRPFLFDMFFEAVNWGDTRFDREEIRGAHYLAHYLKGWPAPDEFGQIAFVDPGYRVGACWVRRFPADDPGFGFVDADTPELTIAVSSTYRRQGIGRELLERVIADSRVRGLKRLSLAAEDENQVTRLYEKAGFREVARKPTHLVMSLDLT